MSIKKLIVSDEVCIGNTCINEDQLKEIINNNGVGQPVPAAEVSLEPVVVPDAVMTPEVIPDIPVVSDPVAETAVEVTSVEAPVI